MRQTDKNYSSDCFQNLFIACLHLLCLLSTKEEPRQGIATVFRYEICDCPINKAQLKQSGVW